MLKKRIIPKLLCVEKTFGNSSKIVLVNTRNFSSTRIIGDPVSQAKIYESQISDELLVLNIFPEINGVSRPFVETVQRLASETFMPLTVGGGIWTEEDFELLLNSGADKISINYSAVTKPQIITAAANKFGSQCVVVSIDHKRDGAGKDRVYNHHDRSLFTLEPVQWAKEVVERGAGEILLTDVDLDGLETGLNVDLCLRIAENVSVPVVVSGGCGLAQHFLEGFLFGKAEGVAAGTFFSKKDQNPMQVRSHVANGSVPIRMEL